MSNNFDLFRLGIGHPGEVVGKFAKVNKIHNSIRWLNITAPSGGIKIVGSVSLPESMTKDQLSLILAKDVDLTGFDLNWFSPNWDVFINEIHLNEKFVYTVTRFIEKVY